MPPTWQTLLAYAADLRDPTTRRERELNGQEGVPNQVLKYAWVGKIEAMWL